MDEAVSLGEVLRGVFLNPVDTLLRRWNWKSAVVSSLVRGLIFFATNLKYGVHTATGAMLAEFGLRAATSGFYGALTQACRRVEPAWSGMVAVLIMLPIANHGLEFLLHWWRGTPGLMLSVIVSVSFTVVSTSFNYFAMRRGLLTVGRGSQTLVEDLIQMPRSIGAYFAAVGGLAARMLRVP